MKRFLVTLALAATAIAAAACSPATAAPSGQPSSQPSAPAGDAITISAKDLKFSTAELVVPADEAFTLRFDNQEAPPHNVAIYTDESASQSIYVGEIFSSGSRDYAVPAMAAGSYFFRCDVHPDMKGTVVAE